MKLSLEQFNNHIIATSLHDTSSKSIVIMSHGFTSSNMGPKNLFVTLSRELEKLGISSLRFDQYGNGNSDGDFFDNSFNDWVSTIVDITKKYQDEGRDVILLGNSMGASASIVAASQIASLKALVALVPDPKADDFNGAADGYGEQGGLRYSNKYWIEAHGAKIYEKLAQVNCETLIISASEDKFMSDKSWRALKDNLQPNHRLEILDGYEHSDWNYEQREIISQKTLSFVMEQLK